MKLPLQATVVVLLLAMVPVGLYAVGESTLAVVGLVNVLLVAGCLYYAFSPADDDRSRPLGTR